MQNEKSLRWVSLLISLLLLVPAIVPSVLVQAFDGLTVDRTSIITKISGFYTTNEFDKASPETVIFIFDGQPIRKDQIDVTTGTVYSLKEVRNNNSGLTYVQPQVASENYRYIPSGYTTAVLERYTTAPRFSQTTRVHYLTPAGGSIFAQGLVGGTAASVIAGFSSFLVAYSPGGAAASILVTIFSLLNGARKQAVANDIWSHTNQGFKVEIRQISSTYGGGTAVFRWSGNRILTHYSLEYPSNEQLVSLSFH